MIPSHLHLFLEKIFSGCVFQLMNFDEDGNILVKFFDAGGNIHEQIWTNSGTVQTVNDDCFDCQKQSAIFLL